VIEAVEEGVAAGGEEAEVGEQGGDVLGEAGGLAGVEGEKGGPDVAAEVVDADEGEGAGEGEGLGEGDAESEAAGEAGALGDGNLGELGVCGRGGGEGEEGGQAVEVLAAGEVGDDAAVFAVEGDLAVDPFADEAAGGVEERERGLVARAFDGEDHGGESEGLDRINGMGEMKEGIESQKAQKGTEGSGGTKTEKKEKIFSRKGAEGKHKGGGEKKGV
jgi:hypothetical protein